MKKTQKGFGVGFVVLILALLAAGGYWYSQKAVPSYTPPPASTEVTAGKPTLPEGEGAGSETNSNASPLGGGGEGMIPADWKTYKNDKYGFEFQYPANWSTTERDVTPQSFHVFAFDPKYGNPGNSIQSNSFTFSFNESHCRGDQPWTDLKDERGWVKSKCFLIKGIELSLQSLDDSAKIIGDKILSTFRFTK